MGWLPSIFGGDKPASDPLGKLDPKLREFLERESPVKYTTASSTLATTERHLQNSAAAGAQSKPNDATTTTTTTTTTTAAVPSASLYQDGRYAHLWKNYRSLTQIEEETASDHDKLMAVLEGFKERKAAIARAGLENCAPQQGDWIDCMKNGSWEDQMQMCRHQVRRFERCYTMQSRFLRALGYGSVAGRPAVVDEDIQMHADALFQRMLQHEVEVEQAKKDGRMIPAFDPALPKTTNPANQVQPSEDIARVWKEKLDQLPEDERIAEEAALKADLQAKADVALHVRKIWDSKKEERESRQAAGQASFTDTIASLVERIRR